MADPIFHGQIPETPPATDTEAGDPTRISSGLPGMGWMPPSVEELNAMVERYEIHEMLGRGGMGAVYLAWQPVLNRPVAFKLLPSELSTDPSFVKRFEREAQSLAKLDHPHIIRIYDFGTTTRGHLYFVMEYVEGKDLAQVMADGPLPEKDVRKIVTQVCDALSCAHAENIIHRDIKPSNILLSKKGGVKIADFGLARPASYWIDLERSHTRVTQSGAILGTLEYMAPEQLMGREVDQRADLYSVGVLLYEMLTGDVPRGAWKPPSSSGIGDARLDQIVHRALEPKPQDRFSLASEMHAALLELDHPRAPVSREAEKPIPPPQPQIKKRSVWPLALILSTLAAALVVWTKPWASPAPPSSQPMKETPVSPSDPAPFPSPIVKPPPPVKPPVPSPAPAPQKPDFLATGKVLADFSQPPALAYADGWNADVCKVENGLLTLAPDALGTGSVSWTPAGAPVDLSMCQDWHPTVQAQLMEENARALFLTIADTAGRTRTWRLAPSSFSTKRERFHVHALTLAIGEARDPSAATDFVDLSQINVLTLSVDPSEDQSKPSGWKIRRVGLPNPQSP